MKNIFLISATTLVLLFSAGCKKKKVADETPADPCATTVCLNGGTCVNGSCACPTGYSGADCGTQLTPTKITITGVTVTKFPTLNGTSTWDTNLPVVGGGEPDLIVKISQGTVVFLPASNQVTNATLQTNTMNGIIPIEVTNLTNQIKIELLDYDSTSASDLMGTADFDLYTSTNKFPAKLTVSNTAGTVTFEVSVTYTY